MCLGIPAKIISIESNTDLLMPAQVNFGGISKAVSLCFTPEAKINDYILVHAGFAIAIIDEVRANELLAWLDRSGEIENEIS